MNKPISACEKVKNTILSYVGQGVKIPSEHEIILRQAESMKLFERNGQIAFGKWQAWSRARTKEEADMLLKKFNEGCVE
ncbi:MAG: hypothetical protein WC236_14700 [Gallionellaceae bacterium]|jgi:hypothetical protein